MVRPRLLELRTRFVSHDPGLQRATLAARAVAGAGIGFGASQAVAVAAGQPLTVSLLGGVVGLIASVAVNDPDTRARALTVALVPFVAGGSLVGGALLAPYPIAGDAAFVAVMAAATYVRRFGPRWTALGMVAFIAYFFSLFLGARPSQLPWLVTAAAIGAAAMATVRFGLLRDRPARRLTRTLDAFAARLADVVETTAESLGRTDGSGPRRRLARSLARANETALSVEDAIEAAAVEEPDAARRVVFEAELSAGDLAATAARVLARDERPDRSEVDELHGLARTLRAGDIPPEGRWDDGDSSVLARARALALGIAGLDRQLGGGRGIGETASDEEEAEPGDGYEDEQDEPRGSLLARVDPGTRQTIQVAFAGVAAIAVGEALSSRRWYWAALTAFVVFANAGTDAHTLRRAGARIAGTAGGIALGLVVGDLLAGDTRVETALIFVFVFAGFYFLPVAYSLMVLFVTIVLALLYGVLGILTTHVLVLRLEETAVGAAAAIAVSLFVLPVRRGGELRRIEDAFLDALLDTIRSAASDAAPAELRRAARSLDGALQEYRTTVRPLVRGFPGARPRRLRHEAVVLAGIAYYARRLAGIAPEVPTGTALDEVVEHVVRDVELLRRQLDGGRADGTPAPAALAQQSDGPEPQAQALRLLRRIDESLLELANSRD